MPHQPLLRAVFQKVVIVTRNAGLTDTICQALQSIGIHEAWVACSSNEPAEIIARADAEGGVPLVLLWEYPHTRFMKLVEKTLHSSGGNGGRGSGGR